MSEVRTKIAAGVTILALAGLTGVAISHPQAPVPAQQSQAAGKQQGKQSTPLAALVKSEGIESEHADD